MTPQEYQMLLQQQSQQVTAPGTVGGSAADPAGRALYNPRSATSAQNGAANSANIATGLLTGMGMRSDDGGGYINPMDVMRAQAAAGTPIGMLYNNAAGQGRENMLLNAGKAEQQQYLAGSQALASGQTGRTAMSPAQTAAQNLSSSGAASIHAGAQDAAMGASAASGMSGDIAGLRQAAAGNVPSAAMIQQKQGVNDAINSQAALAASARGGNLAAAMRGAQAAGAGIQSQGIANNAALRANEMATARGQLTQATGTQAQLYNQAGTVNNALAQTQVGRDNGVVQGQTQIGSQVLGSQMAGVTGVGQSGQMEQGRVDGVIGNDRQDINDLNQYLLQLNNQGLGFGAQNYATDTNAAIQRRGQTLQLIGAGVGAAGTLGAGLINQGQK